VLVEAQADVSTPDRFMYVQTLDTGEVRIVILEAEREHSFTVAASECYSVSGDLSRIAVSQRENPLEITVNDLETGNSVAVVPWQAEWTDPCTFGLSRTDSNMLSVRSDSTQVDVIDVSTGGEVRQFDFSDPSSIAALAVVREEFSLPSLPGIMPENPLYLVSPNQAFVVYQRCLRDLSSLPQGASCTGQDEYVIYDLARQEDVTVLPDPPQLMNDPTVHLSFRFSWSPSGRYLAYGSGTSPLSGRKIIFDVNERSYIDTSGIRAEGYWGTDAMRWSPDEQRLAFLLEPRNSTILGDWVLSMFDLSTGDYTILDGVYQLKAGEWDWLPDGISLAVNQEDDTLLRVALDGTATLIAENVESISTAYTGTGQ